MEDFLRDAGAAETTAPVETAVRQPEADDRILICSDADNRVRWTAGERFHHLFESRFEHLAFTASGERTAVALDGADISYAAVERRANQLAHRLARAGVAAGDRVGLLLNRSEWPYIAMLAVSKVGAAWVPLDRGFPSERIAFICADAGIRLVLCVTPLEACLAGVPVDRLSLDQEAPALAAESVGRVPLELAAQPSDGLCYIIYTSGSTGNPKGVPINHSSICNFIRVAAEVYGVPAEARVYQGMTIAFDFSFEEIWVPLFVGATLVPAPPDATLLGADLASFLREKAVTALCCVPTLLATLEDDLPDLDFLLVSGEACPANLIERWHRPGRRFLNVYGPTEATVTCTWNVARPGGPVTIGRPLPTYSAVILAEDRDEALDRGAVGELAIGGVGVADGYINRPDKTRKAFIPDFLAIGNNPGGQLYRTGDLARITENGEIEYLGRIDTQVKIRGYRIELAEIESVIMEVPGVLQAVVDLYETAPGAKELVAYYTLRLDGQPVTQDLLLDSIRTRLPTYMLPAFFEAMSTLPMLPSNKVDRKRLPPPMGPRHTGRKAAFTPPSTPEEVALCRILGGVLDIDEVSVEDDLFDDLGASSLLLARFCAAVRRELGDLRISMRDAYLNPTVRALAALPRTRDREPACDRQAAAAHVASNREFIVCGVLQAAIYVTAATLIATLLVRSLMWIAQAPTPLVALQHSAVVAAALFAASAILPLILKWIVIGRFTPRAIPVWSFGYLRFWLVRAAIRSSVWVLFAETPIYNLYLRLLGARIGKGAVIGCSVPAAIDLFEVGDRAVIRSSAVVNCYRVRAGRVELGPTVIGEQAYVGSAAVLDINTRAGNGAQIGHASSLQSGQAIPDGRRYHGSPAEATTTDFRQLPNLPRSPLRGALYSAALLGLALAAGSLVLFLLEYLLSQFLLPLHDPSATTIDQQLYRRAAILSALAMLALTALGLALLYALPRLLALGLVEGRTYRLFGVRHLLWRIISLISNSTYFNGLLGDSSYIVPYLKLVGYRLNPVVQTGSNFGLAQRHDIPSMCRIGAGTLVSDGLVMVNSDLSSSCFRLSKVSIGAWNFVGNNVFVPHDSVVGDNCLLATKVMVPTWGPVREDVGLLGSPPFQIPRSRQRDQCAARYRDPAVFRERLGLKNRSNAAAIGLLMLIRTAAYFVMLAIAAKTIILYDHYGWGVMAAAIILMTPAATGYAILLERASIGFNRLQPQSCSIYDAYFWSHERFWKFSFTNADPLMRLLNGTPFKGLVLRLLGVRVGRRLFDDGCWISEKSMTEIGDDCTLGELSTLQGHSLEDAAFKSGRIRIGHRCSLGCNAFIHYDVTMGDDIEIAADSFVMKGTSSASGARWSGNPAKQVE